MLSLGSIHQSSAFYILSSLGSSNLGVGSNLNTPWKYPPRLGVLRCIKLWQHPPRLGTWFDSCFKETWKGRAAELTFWPGWRMCRGYKQQRKGFYVALVACTRESQTGVFLRQKLCKFVFNSYVMAGEEPGKMPELYVEALLKNTDSVSSLRLQCKAKEIYSQRLPKWHLNCTGNLNSQKMLKIGCKHMIICNRLWMSGSASVWGLIM